MGLGEKALVHLGACKSRSAPEKAVKRVNVAVAIRLLYDNFLNIQGGRNKPKRKQTVRATKRTNRDEEG